MLPTCTSPNREELAGEVDRAYTEHLRPSCSFVLSFRPLARLPISPELQSLLGSVLPPGVVRMLSACDLPAVLPTGESLARPRSATLIVELFERPLNEIKQTCFVITARTSAENDGRKRRCTVTDSERAKEEMIRKPASTRPCSETTASCALELTCPSTQVRLPASLDRACYPSESQTPHCVAPSQNFSQPSSVSSRYCLEENILTS